MLGGGQLIPYVQIALEKAGPNIQSHMYRLYKKGPGPIYSPRIREYPRMTSKGRDESCIQKEVKNVCEGFNRVRGQLPPRNVCPRWPVDLSVS